MLKEIISDSAFWSSLLGFLIAGASTFALFWFQQRAERRNRERNALNFLESNIESIIETISELQRARDHSDVIYFDLLDAIKSEVVTYNNTKPHLYVIGNREIIRGAEKFVRDVFFFANRTYVMQNSLEDKRNILLSISKSKDDKIPSNTDVSDIKNQAESNYTAANRYCDNLKFKVSDGQRVLADIRKALR